MQATFEWLQISDVTYVHHYFNLVISCVNKDGYVRKTEERKGKERWQGEERGEGTIPSIKEVNNMYSHQVVSLKESVKEKTDKEVC